MIRRANIEDIDTILSIIHDAQLSLRDLGIDQWQDGYPSREVIEDDMRAGVGYVLCDERNTPIGYAAIVLSGEEAYAQIEAGKWHTPAEYVVVHRLCVAGSVRRRGIAVEFMRYAAECAKRAGYSAFRIDTHRGNVRMLSMLTKLGFSYVGIIYYTSGERLAYDLNLDLTNTL
ncbi:MAG: GNAT family N-acetyltransferase [Alistipes sp.]|nr:GNAT family N-acetyltransferase [Alistipes sp.]